MNEGQGEEHSSHAQREAEKQKREEEKRKQQELAQAAQQRKNYFWITMSCLAFVLFAAVIIYMVKSQPEMYTDREVHWHALFDINICGKKIDLPCLKNTPGIVHGQKFCGVHLLHHHFDNTAHIEGVIPKKEDIALGRFFDEIGVPFDKDRILNSTNGDLCGEQPGVLKMYVNNQPRDDFRDYIPLSTPDARRQIVKLVFEPEGGMSVVAEPTETNKTKANQTNETPEETIELNETTEQSPARLMENASTENLTEEQLERV